MEIIAKSTPLGLNTLLVGDFNAKDRLWSSRDPPNLVSRVLVYWVLQVGLYPLVVDVVTYDKGLGIDLVFTNCLRAYTQLVPEFESGSDYRFLRIKVNVLYTRKERGTVRIPFAERGNFALLIASALGALLLARSPQELDKLTYILLNVLINVVRATGKAPKLNQ